MKIRIVQPCFRKISVFDWEMDSELEFCFNPENTLENLFRVEHASNQRLRRLFFCIRSAVTNFE
jgi:hypothetical protein